MTTKPQSEETLEPCPFCGVTPVRRDHVYRFGSIAEHPEDSYCPLRYCTIGINAWNTRSPASAAPVVGHHKHCSSWTVTTSGEKKPYDCVCECTHSMSKHIRPGEHYWYEDCAVDGCSCMKFTAAAATAAPVEQSDETLKDCPNGCDQYRQKQSDSYCASCGEKLETTEGAR